MHGVEDGLLRRRVESVVIGGDFGPALSDEGLEARVDDLLEGGAGGGADAPCGRVGEHCLWMDVWVEQTAMMYWRE